MQRGKKDVIQLGTAIKNPRQRIRRLHEKLRFPSRSDPSVFSPFQHTPTRIGHGTGKRQRITLAQIDIAPCRQQGPQIVAPPPRPRKTMVNMRRGPNPRRRPHASQRKSTLPQLLRPLQRHAGVVAALGPLECVVYCRSAFGRVNDPQSRCRTRRLPTSSRCAGSRCCPGSPSTGAIPGR